MVQNRVTGFGLLSNIHHYMAIGHVCVILLTLSTKESIKIKNAFVMRAKFSYSLYGNSHLFRFVLYLSARQTPSKWFVR